MDLEEIKAEVESFFEFPTANKDHVTLASAILFAQRILQINNNASWLSMAHTICSDLGILPGHIHDRLTQLRDAIAANNSRVADRCAEIAMSYHHGGTCQISNRCRPCVITDAIRKEFNLSD